MPFPWVTPAPAVLPHLDPVRQRPGWADDLGNCRERLLEAWDEDTIYRGPLDAPLENARPSRGQCGVSSAWLIEQLLDRVDGSKLAYCYGQVSLGSTQLLTSHCWVEVVGDSYDQRWVIDFTADQIEALRRYEVLCWPHDELLERLTINYDSSISRLDPIELSNDLVQKRLDILKANLRARDISAG
ncbi:hypothetical protein [Kribbella lupini]|uniref:Transglutaminase superfamily protein n=1 Tax=Kribbella lupini TaxID=291602 RepID=A0ABN2AA59_9ACTN